jgi:hypothetical protein
MSDTENTQLTLVEINTTIKSRTVREDRDYALSKCDWTQAQDAPLTAEQKAEWVTYRQALRDIPSQEGFPWNVIWPTTP